MDPAPEIEARVERFTRGADLGWIADVLADRRDELLEGWLEATASQPFHRGRRERAVADHIPHLFDALIGLLQRAAPSSAAPGAPLDDPAVLAAAREHAHVRVAQGLQAADVVAEFRLLRQEIGRVLRFGLNDEAPTSDIIGAALLVNDALDEATALGLTALTLYVEEAREDFLATTVHEVRQPITTIKGFIQIAAHELTRPEPNLRRVADSLQRAGVATDRMARILATLTDVSRLTLGRLELKLALVDLAELIPGVVERLDPADQSRVELELPSNLDTTGRWDPAALEQVIANLLSNAVKYSPAGTPIEVAVRGDTDTVQLCVCDHGIGLAADEIARLFQRYGRARSASEQGIEGLGLGLYLSRGIVDAHGGRLWAESAGSGHGTTMHVLLPRRPPPAPTEP